MEDVRNLSVSIDLSADDSPIREVTDTMNEFKREAQTTAREIQNLGRTFSFYTQSATSEVQRMGQASRQYSQSAASDVQRMSGTVARETRSASNDVQRMSREMQNNSRSTTQGFEAMGETFREQSDTIQSESQRMNNQYRNTTQSMAAEGRRMSTEHQKAMRRMIDESKAFTDYISRQSDVARKLSSTMGTSATHLAEEWSYMSVEMRQALISNHNNLMKHKRDLMDVEMNMFKLGNQMGNYTGTTGEFMDEIYKLGKEHKKVTDAMINANIAGRQSIIQQVAVMSAMSGQSEKISKNYDKFGNSLTRANKPLLNITSGLERMARQGSAAQIALEMLGPNAKMKDLQDMIGVITQGIMRQQSVLLAAGAAWVGFTAIVAHSAMGADVSDNLDAQAQAWTDYRDAVQKRTQEIMNTWSLFGKAQIEKTSPQKLLSNLQGQVKIMRDWSKNLSQLAAKGLDEGFISSLREMGPEAAGQIAALNKMSRPELDKYVGLWKEKHQLARKAAVTELEKLKQETQQKVKELQGELKPLGLAFEDFKGTWASALAPFVNTWGQIAAVIVKIGTAVGDFVNTLNSISPNITKMIGMFAYLTLTFTMLLSPLAIGIGYAGGVRAAFAALWPIIGPFVVGFASVAGSAMLLAGALVVVGVALQDTWKHSETFRGIITGAFNGVSSVLKPVADLAKSVVSAIAGWEFLSPVILGLAAAFATLKIIAVTTAAIELFTNAQKMAAIQTKIMTVLTKAWAVAQRALNLSLLANPYIAIAAAIVGIGVALVLAYDRSEKFRNVVNNTWLVVKNAVLTAVSVIANVTSTMWNKALESTEGFRANVVKVISELGPAIAQGFQNAVQQAGSFFANIGSNIAGLFGQGLKDKASGAIHGFIDQLKTGFSSAGGIVSLLAPTITAIGLSFLGVSGPVGLAIAAVVGFIGYLYRLSKTNEDVRNTLISIWSGFQNVLSSIFGALKPIFDVFVQSFKETAQALGPEFQKTGSIISQSLSSLKPTFIELGQVFKELGKAYVQVLSQLAPLAGQLFKAIGSVIATIIPLLGQFIKAWFEVQSSILKVVLSVAMTVLPMLVKAVGQIFPMILKIIQTVLPIVTGLLTSLIPVVIKIAQMIIPLILQAVQLAFPLVLKIVQSVLPVVITLIQTLVLIILKLATTIIPLILSAVQLVFPLILGIIQSVIPIVVGLLKLVTGIITTVLIPAIKIILKIVQMVFPVVVSVIQNALNIVINVLKFFVALFTGNWSGMWSAVLGILKSIWNIIASVLKLALDLIVSVLKAAWSVVSSVTTTIFTAIWNFLKSIFLSIYSYIAGKASEVLTALRSAWTTAQSVTSTVFNAVWNFLKSIFLWIYNELSMRATAVLTALRSAWITVQNVTTTVFNAVWSFLKSVFLWIYNEIAAKASAVLSALRTAWNTVSSVTTSVFNAIWNFLKSVFLWIYNEIARRVSIIVSTIRSSWTTVSSVTSSIFNAVWSFLRNLWLTIFNGIAGFVSNIVGKIRSGWTTAKDKTVEIFNNMKNHITTTFNNIVDGAKALPGKIGQGIKSMASKAMDGVKSLGNTLAGGLESIVNKITQDGINNGVLKKLGVKDNLIPKLTIPRFAHGTSGHAGGLAVLGDGRGSNAGPELFRTPDGRMGLSPATDTLMNLPKGTQVLSATNTRKVMPNLPFYEKGNTGISDFVSSTANLVKNKASEAIDAGKGAASSVANKTKDVAGKAKDLAFDVWDYASDPSKLMNKVFDSLNLKLPNISGFFGQIASSSVKKVKDGAIQFVSNKMNEYMSMFGGDGASGTGIGSYYLGSPFRITTRFTPGGNKNDKVHKGGVHHGLDLAAPQGTPIKSLTDGIVKQVLIGSSTAGNGVRIQSGSDLLSYIHMMSAPSVKQGQHVKEGQLLGRVGSTGFSTGPHLDLKIKRNGAYINPLSYLQGKAGGGEGGSYGAAPSGNLAQWISAGMARAGVSGDAWRTGLNWIIQKESSGNPRAVGAPTSDGTAKGLMQLKHFNYQGDPFNPANNIYWGIKYIQGRYKGIGGAMKWWRSHNWYKDGTGIGGHSGGSAILGDGGKNEPFMLPNGQLGLSPNIPTLFPDLPKGTMVWSSLKDFFKQYNPFPKPKGKGDEGTDGEPSSSDSPPVNEFNDTPSISSSQKSLVYSPTITIQVTGKDDAQDVEAKFKQMLDEHYKKIEELLLDD
ncbi:peptidoglycan DD-metalloendopeptidase family protein [Priestia flexa]|uniref:aggregation-promoting factor C-terminal-like domain-containing protein n=1 Tax=Priestia flexa TaxID=86664 RepID=UPI0024926847|nr:peptidoglycan DD-metalloendopeptidase family protein [Priestia flexa]